MGTFSRLFGGVARDKDSYVRAWAKKRQRELWYSHDFSIENLFALVIWGLSTFGDEDTRQSMPSDMRGSVLDVSEHYSGDASLFELGCYLYLRLDLWLFKHRPQKREAIVTVFADRLVKLFSQALNCQDIQALFNERLRQYANLVRAGADIEEYHYHLSQLILRTRDNLLPKSYDFEKEPLMLSALEEIAVKLELTFWEEGMIPGFVKSLEKYCDLTK